MFRAVTLVKPRDRRAEKSLCVMRAIFDAKPGKEKKAVRRALKRFKAEHPKACRAA